MEEHLHDNSTTDERPFSDEAEKTLKEGFRMLVNDIAFSLRDNLDAQSIRQEVTLDIEKAHHKVEEVGGHINDLKGELDDLKDKMSELEGDLTNDIDKINDEIAGLLDTTSLQTEVNDLRQQVEVLTDAISNMLLSNADNAAHVSTEFGWAIKQG